MVWLGMIAQPFYQKQIGHLLKPNVNWGAAIVFYLLFLAGLTTFVLEPMAGTASVWQIGKRAGLFGLICYATYDLTNLAVTKDWPLTVTVVDMAWGTVLSGLVATITVMIAQKFFL